MYKSAIAAVCLICLVSLNAATYRSSALGWKVGANVDTQLASFLDNTAQAGDTLKLEALYKVTTYNNTFPDNFVLTAVKGGGFDITGTVPDQNSGYYFVAGKNMVLNNCTFTCSSAPETDFQGNNPVRHVDFHNGQMWNGKAGGLTVTWCSFSGNLGNHITIKGTFTIKNSSFYRGAYQISINGPTDGYLYQSLWDDGLIDGIKSWRTSGANTGWLVEDCIFQNSRDGIDVTGGLQDSEIRNTIFRHLNVTAFDAKYPFNSVDDINHPQGVTKNVVFNDCQFIDINSCIVSTFGKNTDYPATYAQQEARVPQYITINRCTFEATPQRGGSILMYLVKMGHHISWTDAVIRGDVKELRITNPNVQDGWESHHISGTITDTLPARDRNFDVHFNYGPQDDLSITGDRYLPGTVRSMYGPGKRYNLQGCRVYGRGRVPAGIYLKEYDGVLVKTVVH